MKKLNNFEEVRAEINKEELSLVYASQVNCSVCHGLLPQVEELLKNYPNIKALQIDLGELAEFSGQFSVFTVPAILLFYEGKELMRKARFIPIDDLDSELKKYQELFS